MESKNIEKSSQDFMDTFFNTKPDPENIDHKRKSVRYIRDDIKASIKENSLFSNKPPIEITLHDISTHGALISPPKTLKLKAHQKILLILEFTDGKIFSIEVTVIHSKKVVHHKNTLTKEFGLKFARRNNELGEYLVKTQTDLNISF